VLNDGSTALDQGNGFLDVGAAFALLEAGKADGTLPTPPAQTGLTAVSDNIRKFGLRPIRFSNGAFTTTTVDMLPGQVTQFVIDASPSNLYTIDIQNIVADSPPEQQNSLYGDSLLIGIFDSEVSLGNILDSGWFGGFAPPEFQRYTGTYRFQSGLARIALMGDVWNAGRVSVTLTIKVQAVLPTSSPDAVSGRLRDQSARYYDLVVPRNNLLAKFNLTWPTDWHFNPTHDIDLLVSGPDGTLDLTGATMRNPESFLLARLAPGTYTLTVDGFALHGMTESFSLSVTDQNSRPLELNRRRTPPVVVPADP
jgi:hypothetical protein